MSTPIPTRTHKANPTSGTALPSASGKSESGQQSGNDAYRPEIQGLRAVAVTLVVLFHLWPHRVSGGYVGVDVFFVISGYLITSHIFREVAQTGRLRVVRFWARRVRRLLPASLLVLVLSAVAVFLLAPVTMWQLSARQIAASALYVQNWALAYDAVDYLAADNVPTVAQHYWSLSVEEQFYAVWPLLIVGLLALQRWVAVRRRRNADPADPSPDQRRLVLVAGLGILALASLLWSVWSTGQDQAFAYMSTFTRIWEFAVGALAALVTVTFSRRVALVSGWFGAVAIVLTGYLYTEQSQFPGWIALLPVLGTAAVILAGRVGASTVGWWLSLRPARFVGDISYSIYLIHWPLIVVVPYATGRALAWPEKLAIIVVTLALAWLSKTHVEDPMRTRPLLAKAPWRSFAFAALGMSVLVAAHSGFNVEFRHRATAAASAAAHRLDQGGPCLGPAALVPTNDCGAIAGSGPLVAPPELVAQEGNLGIFAECQQSLASADLKTCHLGQQDHPKRTVALVGDSHAGALLPLMDKLGKQMDWDVIAATKASCPATSARRVLPKETSDERQVACEAFNAKVDAQILKNPAITDVFTSSFSSAYTWADTPGGSLSDPEVDGFQLTWARWIAAGKHVHVVRDVPGTDDRSIPNCLALAGNRPQACATARSVALPNDVAVTAALAMRNPRVTVLDLTPFFCDKVTCFGQVGDVIVYRDTSHVSVEYAELLAPFVEQRLKSTTR